MLFAVWFVVMGCCCVCAAVLRLAVKLPAAVLFAVCLPAMPFIVAWRNRQQHPIQAKIICWLGGILYLLIALIVLIDGHL